MNHLTALALLTELRLVVPCRQRPTFQEHNEITEKAPVRAADEPELPAVCLLLVVPPIEVVAASVALGEASGKSELGKKACEDASGA